MHQEEQEHDHGRSKEEQLRETKQPVIEEKSAFEDDDVVEVDEEMTDQVDAALERAAAFQREKAKLKAQTTAFT